MAVEGALTLPPPIAGLQWYDGAILAADTNFVLHDDPGALAIARKVVRRRLGVSA